MLKKKKKRISHYQVPSPSEHRGLCDCTGDTFVTLALPPTPKIQSWQEELQVPASGVPQMAEILIPWEIQHTLITLIYWFSEVFFKK